MPAYILELDWDKRNNAFKAIQQHLHYEEVFIPLVHILRHWGFSETIVGVDEILLALQQAEWDQIGHKAESSSSSSSDTNVPPGLDLPLSLNFAIFGIICIVIFRRKFNSIH